MLSEILLATTNAGKLAEFQLLLKDLPVTLTSLDESFKNDLSLVENKNTFLGNAIEKALFGAKLAQGFCLADDSGLCIEALNYEPGVFSARYFEEGNGIKKILNQLENEDNRKAYFVCCLVIVDLHGKLIWHTEKKWHGFISKEPLGEAGFGYDPIFIPEGFSQTASQLGLNLKNTISHRSKAIEELKIFLKTTSP